MVNDDAIDVEDDLDGVADDADDNDKVSYNDMMYLLSPRLILLVVCM